MGKYKGSEARYNVISVRVDDELKEAVDRRLPKGVSISDFMRDLLRRECSAYQSGVMA